MKKKTAFVLLGTALVGALTVFLLSTPERDGTPVAPESSSSSPSLSANSPVTPKPPVPSPLPSKHEPVASTATPSTPQASELEPEIRDALGNILNTSSEGLVEETRNGVTSVDLKGRFQTAPVATIGKDGTIQITDYSHLPKAAKQP
ncbi:MAG TPA: hypothetical protein ENI83_00765 [Gammaproteobacteria bacterium]|nr:hypothetical protein [Gammaproteobacteria bacterium]